MNPLLLQGFGTSLSVLNRRLVVREGRFSPLSFTRTLKGGYREPRTLKFKPREIPYDAIFVHGSSGWISFQAMRWLVHHNTAVFMLDHDGSILSSTMPPQSIRGDLRKAQVEAYLDSKIRLTVARSLIEAKLERSNQILNWLRETHDIELEIRRFKKEASKLISATHIHDVRGIEGRAAQFYWAAFQKAVPSKLEFRSRSTSIRKRQNNANDPTNCLLNYGYSVLQGYVRRAINMTGLESSLGFVHEDKPSTTPLIFDLEEPYRFLVDLTVLDMIESGMYSWDDFYFTAEDFRLRIKPTLLDRYADLIREQFNSGVNYRGQSLNWDTVIEQKVIELSRFLTGKSIEINFTEPRLYLQRPDSLNIRRRILSLTQQEANKLGIQKSTLHYLRLSARRSRSFKISCKVKKRLELTS